MKILYALEVGEKNVHNKNKCKQMKGGRCPIKQRMTVYITEKCWKRFKKIQYTVRRKYLSHFQNRVRHRLRRAAVSSTVIEPRQNHPKSSFMKDSSLILAFIWDRKYSLVCLVTFVGNSAVKTVLPAQFFLFFFLVKSKNWLFTYIYS